jgi:hypothetical protein
MMHGQANINQEGKQKWPLFQKSIGSDYYRAICCLITVGHPFVAQVSSSSFLSLLSIATTFYFYIILHNIQQVAWQLWRKRMNWQSRNKFDGVLYSSSPPSWPTANEYLRFISKKKKKKKRRVSFSYSNRRTIASLPPLLSQTLWAAAVFLHYSNRVGAVILLVRLVLLFCRIE